MENFTIERYNVTLTQEAHMAKRGRPIVHPAIRFEKFVDRSGDCHLWTGSTNNKGYGQFSLGIGHIRGAHRYAWELLFGPIPDGLFVCHSCDNPPCVNIEHLWLGTNQMNMDDMMAKGRNKVPDSRGEASASAKITEEQALAIRASDEPYKVLAERYGVRYGLIRRVKVGESWAHLPLGEKTANAVLTKEQVLAIRDSDEPYKVLSEEYGVGPRQIGRVKRREAWAHV
jgi:hypothetical protein